MKTVSVHQAKPQLSALLAEIERTGEEVVICRHRKPVAHLVPHRRRSRLEPHQVMRDVGIACEVTGPLAPDEWAGQR